jgi:hypothetical protein
MRLSILVGSLAVAMPAPAQVEVVDEGSFTLYVHGQRVGREQFAIRRSPGAGGPVFTSKATISLDGRRIESTVRADSAGFPIDFALEEFSDGRLETRVRGNMVGARFLQQMFRGGAQSEKELRLTRGTVVADIETVHHYYFIARVPADSRVHVLVPRRFARDSLAVSVRAEHDEVELGNGRASARHLMVVDAAGISTDVWLDARGRVLRVAIPSRGFVAVRDAPPA